MQHLPRAESSPKNRILIVDDDPSVQKLFSKMLSHNGYRIALASDGFEAGIKTVQFKPDLMILDLVMSGMDGFEVCKHIKENPNTSHIKVLAYTGYDTKAYRHRIMQAGADGDMAISVSKSTILNHIKGLLDTL